jgi:hypothetical protein
MCMRWLTFTLMPLRKFALLVLGFFLVIGPVLAAKPAVALPDGFDLFAHERPRLIRLAEAALSIEPVTVTAAVNPRSAGGVHDFSSEADYWWPDPANPEAPYIQRDGLSNPDNFLKHREFLLDLATHVPALAAAYRVTKDERYAAAAVKHLHAWFVEPSTKMNPSLEYSQAIKGRNTGRSIGVIDTLHLCEVALAVEVLRGSKALTSEKEAAVTGWFRAYLKWMRTHPYGIEESEAANNHGTCAWLQIACFARLVGDEESFKESRRRFKEILLPNQMAPNGSFLEELRRTKPYGYSIFNLDVMTGLAVVASAPDEDLVTWALPDGRSIVKGITWLAPYMADKDAWLKNVHRTRPGPNGGRSMPTNELVQPDVMYWNDWPVRQPFLIFGVLSTGRSDWLEIWKKLEPDPTQYEVRRNLPIRQPVLWMR